MTIDNIIIQPPPPKSTTNGLKSQLRHILKLHEGPNQAITGHELTQLLGYKNDRTIRLSIRELISDGYPIASSTENPPGYFIITSRKQAEQYANSIKNRLIEDAKRRRDFRIAADKWLTPAIQEKLI